MRTLIILLVVLAAGAAWAFEWEGELDPNEFDKWTVISVQPTPQGLVWMFAKNPDEASAIDVVAMAVDSNFTLLSYRYFKHGEPHSYFFNVKEGKYVRYQFTEEQRKSCMNCHSEKLVPQALI